MDSYLDRVQIASSKTFSFIKELAPAETAVVFAKDDPNACLLRGPARAKMVQRDAGPT